MPDSERDITALDRQSRTMQWRDKLPLILTIALLPAIPIVLMQRFDNAVAARNLKAAAWAPYKIKPIFTPLPHHSNNGIATIWIYLKPDGSVDHLRDRRWNSAGFTAANILSENTLLHDVAAAAARSWRFDVGGTRVRIDFEFQNGRTRATWVVDE